MWAVGVTLFVIAKLEFSSEWMQHTATKITHFTYFLHPAMSTCTCPLQTRVRNIKETVACLANAIRWKDNTGNQATEKRKRVMCREMERERYSHQDDEYPTQDGNQERCRLQSLVHLKTEEINNRFWPRTCTALKAKYLTRFTYQSLKIKTAWINQV